MGKISKRLMFINLQDELRHIVAYETQTFDSSKVPRAGFEPATLQARRTRLSGFCSPGRLNAPTCGGGLQPEALPG
jgi:hypothetical protein